MSRKNIVRYRNTLATVRRRKSIARKRVAKLLGHKSTDQISRYERGTTIPSLKTALKLALIYQSPVRKLLSGYFETCREEVSFSNADPATDYSVKLRQSIDEHEDIEFCTIEERLQRDRVNGTDLARASRHTTKLINLRTEKLGHI